MHEWDDDFLPAFWRAKRSMTREAGRVLEEHGVHEGQQFLLMCLWNEDGLTPGEVARRIDVSTPTVTRTATRLAAVGLVERRSDEVDSRLVRLCLTERGRSLREPLGAAMRAMSRRALGGMTEEESAQLIRLLARVNANMESSVSE
ncbi:MarR family winged helix-turn-helix transcriptional regulator [Spiractinospora alimapuensis]|uniref:MarR family winged helix-turn-helix transcriptional regulator n=1 Tax=Spiractinospora alimapuensis TaxID=2820884 RepID=UPI001F427D2A|nr:MarR family transcriptional regulator [Spiractinospora alimapuensis]